ncbi:MAG: hypothetical protein LBS60_15135 [Deltaproteobacteria bacterium]|nr:hypothetical protein [Deltaproteobacteria bacterium]
MATIGGPINPMRYPQLLPSILSLPYVFMSDTWIQFFSYAICLLFPTCIILTCLTIFDKYPLSSFLAVAILFLWPIQKFVHYSGYADIPVTTIGFMAAAAVIWGYQESDSVKRKCLILAAIFLGGSGALKQAGLLLLVCFPLIIWEFQSLKFQDSKLKINTILKLIFLVLFFTLPWNIYNIYLIDIGENFSNIQYVTEDIHSGRSLFERFIAANKKHPGLLIFTILAAPGLWVAQNRSISFFGILFSLVWMVYFSYDAKNFYLAIPFLGFSIGLSFQKLILDKYNILR